MAVDIVEIAPYYLGWLLETLSSFLWSVPIRYFTCLLFCVLVVNIFARLLHVSR